MIPGVEQPTFHAALQEWATRMPDAIAVAAPGRPALSYARLCDQIIAGARSLHSFGIGRGDRIAIVLPQGPDLAVTVLTVAAVAAAAPFNPGANRDDFATDFESLAPKALIVPVGSDHPARTVAEERGIAVVELVVRPDAPAGVFYFQGKQSQQAADTGFNGLDDAALLLATSGTTSKAKFVPLTQRNVRAAADNTRAALQVGPQDRCLVAATLFHAHGLVAGMMSSLMAGSTAICPPAFDAEAFFAWLDEFNPTWYTAVPTVHQAILREASRHTEVVARQHLRVIRSASAYLPDAVRAELEETFRTVVTEGYGLTEAMQLTNTPLNRQARKVGSLGVTGSSEIVILDETGRHLGPGEPGEIVARGPVVMSGYLNLPDLNAAVFRHGWFRTGDIGYLDSDGHLYMSGRIKDQINRGGEKISPQEIDRVLLDHPAISQALAFGLEHPTLGEEVAAAVVLRAGILATPEEIIAHAAASLQDFKVPRKVFIVASMPANPTGKLLRRTLASRLEEMNGRPAYVPPRDALEQALSGIWEEVLGHSSLGIHDNFFDMGGQSLLAAQVIGRIRKELSLDASMRLLFERPTIAQLGQALSSEKKISLPAVVPVPRAGSLPLSFAQQRLWFLEQMEPGSTAYSTPESFRLTGPLDVEAFRRAVTELTRRHEALRTTFHTIAGEPVQVIAPEIHCHVPLVNLCGIPADQRETEAKTRAELDASTPFDLEAGPLLRATLLHLGENEYVLLFNMHHIISDGWSKVTLTRELSTLYDVFSNGLSSPLPEPALQYVDYASWQKTFLQGELLERQLDYWQRQLDGAPALLELPTDRPRPALMSHRGRRVSFHLPENLSRQLNELARREGATLYQVLLSAFHVLLSRYCRQDDVVTGSPIAGRQLTEFEPIIGFFVNTLALRTQVDRRESFRSLLARVRETTLSAYQNQDVPFERLVEELHPQRSRAYSPLFQVMFILQNNAPRSLALSGLSVEPFATETAVTKFDLTLSLEERNGRLSGFLEYRVDLFNAVTIERLAENIRVLLEGVVVKPDDQVGKLPLLSEGEKRILEKWNPPVATAASHWCVHHFFEEQAARAPDAPAAVFEGSSLTYRELNEKANQLAHRLRRQGVGPDVRVGMFFERSLEMVVSLLGILKAGGAYVALDPVLPQERLLYLLEDAKVAALVTQSCLVDSLPTVSMPRICLDADASLDQEETGNPTSGVGSENLVYVIYTSGSTGKPKGVGIEHRQLVNYVLGLKERFGFTPGASYATVSTLSADLGNTVLFSALVLGGCLHVIAQERLLSGEAMADYFRQHHIDCLKITPSHLAALQSILDPSQVMPRRWLVLGGEASTLQWIDQLRQLAPGCAIYNHYGPTETTVGVLTFRVSEGPPETSSSTLVLGRPLPNSQMFIVDSDLQPIPVGVSGELLIGGAGVGRGYLGRPELTEEKFIRNPFGDGRLYRSGDLVRYCGDGCIEFLGRFDDQVKIRGFRVEIGEVESAIGQHPLVNTCKVLATDGAPGEKRLVAYVVGESLDQDELREFLRKALPEYMVPSVFVQLEKLPLTANGKLDRRALPDAGESSGSPGRSYVASRNDLEQCLVKIWQQVLGVDKIGIDDDFFDLGGHSLLAVRLFAKISAELSGEQAIANAANLRPSLLWSASTVRQLAEHLKGMANLDVQHRLIIEIQRGAAGHTPFVMLTGDWGGLGFYVRNLARSLDARQPVYALMPHDITQQDAPKTIEAMADAFLPVLRAALPQGPYMLGGYSQAGLVAMEMSRRLRASGEHVPFVFAIDTSMPDPRLRYLRLFIRVFSTALRWSPEEETEAYLAWHYRFFHARELWAEGLVPMARYYLRRFSGRRSGPFETAGEREESVPDMVAASYIRAARRYIPSAYSGPIRLISSLEGPASRRDDATLGWEKVSDDLNVFRVPGNHVTCLTQYADEVASHLSSCMEGAVQGAAALSSVPPVTGATPESCIGSINV